MTNVTQLIVVGNDNSVSPLPQYLTFPSLPGATIGKPNKKLLMARLLTSDQCLAVGKELRNVASWKRRGRKTKAKRRNFKGKEKIEGRKYEENPEEKLRKVEEKAKKAKEKARAQAKQYTPVSSCRQCV